MTHSYVISQVARHYRKCNATKCPGEIFLFHYKWCNQYRLRCNTCGKSIKDVIYEQNTPSLPVGFMLDAIRHDLAESVWQKFSTIEFESYEQMAAHLKPKAITPTLLF